jgi:hypothetical protein
MRAILGRVCTLLAVTVCGCGEKAADDPPTAVARSLDGENSPSTDSPPVEPDDKGTPGEPRVRKFPGIELTIPAGWKEVELSDFQRGIIAAKYELPPAGSEVTLTISFVGGGIGPNLQRWVGQIKSTPADAPKTETLKVQGVDAQWIDLRGTYNTSFGPKPGAKPNWRILGAAVPIQPQDCYLKLIGPRDVVAKAHDDFRRLVRTARLTK